MPDRAFIDPPRRIPLLFRPALAFARRRAGGDVLPAELLTWYPRAAVGSGVMEALVAHHDGRVDERMLKFVRMAVSFTVECPFCIGINSQGWEKVMTESELTAVQGHTDIAEIATLTPLEWTAIEYARLASATPPVFPPEFVARLTSGFTEREIVVLATTAAQVNYWARLTRALGAPAAG